jgi:hypothetical protein
MKTVSFRDTHIDFQEACVHCLGWARETYPFERTFTFGRQSMLVQIPAPLCPEHLRRARTVSPSQTWADRIGIALAVMIGLAVGAGLLYVRSAAGSEISFLNVLLAVVAGICLFVTVWAIAHFWLTPQFASAETKAILHSLRITKYDPFRQILELTFVNDSAAELARRANLELLAPAEEWTGLKRFQISAHILSHDIRLSSNIDTVVPLEQAPSETEAEALLQPVIDLVLARNLGEGCFYEIDVEVREVPGSVR